MNFEIFNYIGIIIPVVVIGIMVLVFGPFIFRLIKTSSKNRDLLAHGQDAEATIISIRETGVRINEQPQVNITLEVRPLNGTPVFQAQATTVISYFQITQFQPGARVQVKYDPNDTSKVAIAAVVASTMAANPYAAAPMMANGNGMMQGQAMTPQQAAQVQELVKIDAANKVLMASGEAAQATIVNKWDLGVKVNGENPAVRVQVEVHPTNRPAFQAQAVGVIAATSVQKYQPGSTIWVKFDPNDISRVTMDHS